MKLDDRTIARGVAGGRVAFGLFALLLPKVLARRVGDGQVPPPPYPWWLRAFGIRDVVLGYGTWRALASGDDADAARWVEMGAVADSADFVTSAVFAKDLDRQSQLTNFAVAGVASALGWKSARGLRRG